MVAEKSMSLICSAAELKPRSASGDAAIISTPTLDVAMPMPAPATAHSDRREERRTPRGCDERHGREPVAMNRNPTRTSVWRSISGCRDAHIDAPAQPSALSVSGMPASSGE